MGLPMSVLVAKAGYAVTAFDQSPTGSRGARARHCRRAFGGRRREGRNAVVITSLPDDAALRAVDARPHGLISAMAPKSILIETSTVSAEVSARSRRRCESA